MPDNDKKGVIELDGKLPVWGMCVFLVAQMVTGWQWISDIDRRLAVREGSSVRSIARIEKLEADVADLRKDGVRLARVEESLKRIDETLGRLDRKLDSRP